MAVNPVMGPIVQKATDDPNGPPGKTSGNVPVTDALTTGRQFREPTAGAPPGQPQGPHYNPLEEAFFPPSSQVGPGQ